MIRPLFRFIWLVELASSAVCGSRSAAFAGRFDRRDLICREPHRRRQLRQRNTKMTRRPMRSWRIW
jgi:hypothetical protein